MELAGQRKKISLRIIAKIGVGLSNVNVAWTDLTGQTERRMKKKPGFDEQERSISSKQEICRLIDDGMMG